jgi:hypothetical protein
LPNEQAPSPLPPLGTSAPLSLEGFEREREEFRQPERERERERERALFDEFCIKIE